MTWSNETPRIVYLPTGHKNSLVATQAQTPCTRHSVLAVWIHDRAESDSLGVQTLESVTCENTSVFSDGFRSPPTEPANDIVVVVIFACTDYAGRRASCTNNDRTVSPAAAHHCHRRLTSRFNYIRSIVISRSTRPPGGARLTV